MNVSRCDQKRLPVTKSGIPSLSMSEKLEPCSSEKVTPPALEVEKSPMIMCFSKVMSPVALFFCSNHANPQPCACRLVTMSLRPSPFTS
jgi:hypothetical protein